MKCPFCKAEWVSTQRSNNQNRYFHGVVLPMISEEMGEWDTEHVKDMLKDKFLVDEEMVVTKKGISFLQKKIKHTSELNTLEFKIFVEKCVFWAREFLKIEIPEPVLK